VAEISVLRETIWEMGREDGDDELMIRVRRCPCEAFRAARGFAVNDLLLYSDNEPNSLD
jgi:hypothetical protein